MASANEIADAFEEIVPPSASASSSTPTKRVPCDVFINHRGPDTKHTLATSIYRTLKLMGLQVFLDEPELELGDFIPSEIQDAMTTSFLHIAILSPTYAESPWCLAELSFMLKTGKTIIPVFYNVDPKHIRWVAGGKGIYTDAFSKHEASGRYTSEKLKDWKLALQNVTYLTGHIVKENDDEGKLLKRIVNYVQKHPEKISLVVAKHPVGLDETLQDFERRAFDSSENVKIVGLVGMGGCGKTTLAKEYYNKKRFSIYRSSFVCNVRDTPAKNLHEMQKKMFQDLGGSKDRPFDNVEEGKAILARHLRSVQVFIILDDVDHLDQLDSLLPIKDSLQKGSVIVVTSRDSSVLTSWGISSIYRMKELKPKHAMELFCWHAFLQPSPINGFECLLKEFLKVCRGLPLSLKVLGGLVHNKSQEYWNDQLNKVTRLLPKDIKEILKVSFDALDEEDREIFLDICCFFIGKEKHLAITVWDGSDSGWSGVCSLETLENKCLVEVDGSNCIRMHDHLRDLGKEIAKTWSPYRLWSPQQITHIEKQGQGSVLIRGIRAETDDFFEECLELVRGSGIRFKRRLEILVLGNNCFPEEFATLSAGLVWLQWDCTGHKSLPSWLSLKKLRILELNHAYELEELWSDTANPPVQLRELNIFGAESFRRFPRSIGFLKHLKKLSLICTWPAIGVGAPIEGLPEEFCCLQSLEHLELRGCGELQSLPSKFGDLTSLRHLDLGECSRLMMLPETFGQLTTLETLTLYDNHHLVEIDSLPVSLKRIDLSKCSNLKRISRNCGLVELEELFISGAEELYELPNFAELVSLKVFAIIHSGKQFKKIEGLENCRSLEDLKIETWGNVPLIQSLEHMGSLRTLDLSAWNISIFEPCLKTIKKWPSECIICARAVHGVEVIVKTFTFAGLTLVDSCEIDGRGFLTLKCGQWHSSYGAVMLCFVINSASDFTVVELYGETSRMVVSQTKVKEGKWVWIGVFTLSSSFGREEHFLLSADNPDEDMGILLIGEEKRVVEAFYELLLRLGKVSDTPEKNKSE